MEDLRLLFLIIGAIAIAGILVHGLWSVRKNASSKDKQKFEPVDWTNDDGDMSHEDIDQVTIDIDDPLLRNDDQLDSQAAQGGFDDLGIGQVRVVNEPHTDNQASEQNAGGQTLDSTEQTTETETETETSDTKDATEQPDQPLVDDDHSEQPAPKIYSSVVTQPKPEFAAEQLQSFRSKAQANGGGQTDEIPEPPPFLLRKDQPAQQQIEPEPVSAKIEADSVERATVTKQHKVDPDFMQPLSQKDEPVNSPQAPEKASLAEQAKNLVRGKKTTAGSRKRKEPKVTEDQMKIDFDEPHEQASSASATPDVQQEVLVLNVKAPDDNPIQGAALLPMLLTLGFKFGDQDIFHRHVNSNGKGPVLFSLANMFKPGVFDIDNLENFTTQGISLFMILPIEGDPHQVFNMMHNAARKIADEFSSQVLDGRRSALNKQSLQQYIEKIREFERQRMIAR